MGDLKFPCGDRIRKKRVYLPLSLNVLAIIATGLLLVDIILHLSLFGFASLSLLLVGGVATQLQRQGELNYVTTLLQRISARYGVGPFLFLIMFGVFWLDYLAAPASAQFFQGAEDWMTGVFPDAAEVVPLIFNVLRGLFLLYLGISLVQVVQAARQDEDWKSLSRTPMIILIAVTVADILTGLIIGGGGAGGGAGGGGGGGAP